MSNLNPETRREFARKACQEGGWREVEADSVADYLNRYYRRERRTETLLATYEKEFAEEGFVSTSHWDNITGEHICWFGPRVPRTDGELELELLRAEARIESTEGR